MSLLLPALGPSACTARPQCKPHISRLRLSGHTTLILQCFYSDCRACHRILDAAGSSGACPAPQPLHSAKRKGASTCLALKRLWRLHGGPLEHKPPLPVLCSQTSLPSLAHFPWWLYFRSHTRTLWGNTKGTLATNSFSEQVSSSPPYAKRRRGSHSSIENGEHDG